MNRIRFAFWIPLALLGVVVLGLAAIQYRSSAPRVRVSELAPADREIAWFHTATNTANWERFVTGIHVLADQGLGWTVDDSNAFLDSTTEVPEVVLGREKIIGKLRFRWYKQSSEATVRDWVGKLQQRPNPPLAVIGGGSSDRAKELAEALNEAKLNWPGPAPLLFITTATASKLDKHGSDLTLVDPEEIYVDRTTRFCFNNERIAESILSFVWFQKDALRPRRSRWHGLLVGGVAESLRDPRPTVTAIEWGDDPYSGNLVNHFKLTLNDPVKLVQSSEELTRPSNRTFFQTIHLTSSIGGFLRPNRWEAAAISDLFQVVPRFPLQRTLPQNDDERALLIVPGGPNPARRLLATLLGRDPRLSRRLVVLCGDNLSFNNIYRDGELLWNVRQVPVPLVLFAHENPVDWAMPEDELSHLKPPTATDDVLLMKRGIQMIAEVAYGVDTPGQPGSEPVSTSELLREGVKKREPDRSEYIVYLRPVLDPHSDRLAVIEVWRRQLSSWKMINQIEVPDRSRSDRLP